MRTSTKIISIILCAILVINITTQLSFADSYGNDYLFKNDKTDVIHIFSIDGTNYVAHEKYIDGVLHAIRIDDQNGTTCCIAYKDPLTNTIYVSDSGLIHIMTPNGTQRYPYLELRGAWGNWLCNTYNLGEAGTFTALGLAVQLALILGGVVLPDIVSYSSDVLSAAGIDDHIWIKHCVRYKVEDGYQYVNQRITAYFNASCTGDSVGPFETLQRKALDAKGLERLL